MSADRSDRSCCFIQNTIKKAENRTEFLRWLLSGPSRSLDALISTGCCFQEQTVPVCCITASRGTEAGGRIEMGGMELDPRTKTWCAALGVTWGGWLLRLREMCLFVIIFTVSGRYGFMFMEHTRLWPDFAQCLFPTEMTNTSRSSPSNPNYCIFNFFLNPCLTLKGQLGKLVWCCLTTRWCQISRITAANPQSFPSHDTNGSHMVQL